MLSSLHQLEASTGLQHKVRVDLKYNCMTAKLPRMTYRQMLIILN